MSYADEVHKKYKEANGSVSAPASTSKSSGSGSSYADRVHDEYKKAHGGELYAPLMKELPTSPVLSSRATWTGSSGNSGFDISAASSDMQARSKTMSEWEKYLQTAADNASNAYKQYQKTGSASDYEIARKQARIYESAYNDYKREYEYYSQLAGTYNNAIDVFGGIGAFDETGAFTLTSDKSQIASRMAGASAAAEKSGDEATAQKYRDAASLYQGILDNYDSYQNNQFTLGIYQDPGRSADSYAADIDALKKEVEQARSDYELANSKVSAMLRGNFSQAEKDLANEDVKAAKSRLDELEQQLDAMQTEQWSAAGIEKYGSITGNADFEEKSQVDASKPVLGNGQKWNYINDTGKRQELWSQEDAGKTGTDPNARFRKYDYMTDEEKATYNYLYNVEGRKAANEYLDYIGYELDKRRTGDYVERISETSADGFLNGLGMSAASVGSNMASGLGLASAAAQNVRNDLFFTDYKPINYYGNAFDASRTTTAIRGSVSSALADEYGAIQFSEEEIAKSPLKKVLNGKSLGDLYQLGMSMADSAAVGYTFGAGATFLLGGAAGTQGVLDALERGATDEQALAMGILNGTFETLFEYVSLDKLINTSSTNILQGFFTQGFIEGTEEFNTTLFNTIADIIVMSDKSEMMRAYQEYLSAYNGDAKRAATATMEEFALNLGMDFIGGAISGGLMGGTAATYNNLSEARQYGIDYGRDAATVGALKEGAAAVGGEITVSDKAQKRLDAGKKISGAQVRTLAQQYETAIQNYTTGELTKQAQSRLTTYGETGNTEAVAGAVAKALTGSKLTSAEQNTLSASKYGQRVLNEMNPVNAENGDYNTGWAEESGATDLVQSSLIASAMTKAKSGSELTSAELAAVNGDSYATQQYLNTYQGIKPGLFTQVGDWRNAGKESAVTETENTGSNDAVAAAEARVEKTKQVISEIQRNTQIPADQKSAYMQSAISMYQAAVQELADVKEGKTPAVSTAAAVTEATPSVPQSTKVTAPAAVKTTASVKTPGTIEEASKSFGKQAGSFLESFKPGQDVERYTSAYRAAYEYGKLGLHYDNIKDKPSLAYLTEQQREEAYNTGRDSVRQNSTGEKKTTGENGKRREGTVSARGMSINDLVRTLNDKQRVAYKIISNIAKATGIDVVLFASKTDSNGNYIEENGKFVHDSNTIYVDINSGLGHVSESLFAKNVGDFSQYVMLRSFTHEFVHFVENNSSLYDALRQTVNMVLEQRLDGTGLTVDDLIRDTQKKYQEALGNPEFSYDEASREVIADALSDILRDSNSMSELAQTQPGLFAKLKAAFERFVRRIKEYYDGLAGNDNVAANALQEYRDGQMQYLKSIQYIFDQAATDAVENYQRTHDVDKRVSSETESELEKIGSTTRDGVVVSMENAELIDNGDFSKPVDVLEQFSFTTTKPWAKTFEEEGGSLDTIATVKDFTDAMMANDAIAGWVPTGYYKYSKYGPLRKNVEYRWSFDMDASCPRTFQFVNYRNALQKIAGRPLTDKESMNLMYLMRRMNQQIPCTYCYVENKRILKNASYLNYFNARNAVMSASTDAEALTQMYSYNEKTGKVGAAAQKVFDEWRADVNSGKAFHPSAQECWTEWQTAKNSVFNYLDEQLAAGEIRLSATGKKNTSAKQLVNRVVSKFGVTGDEARREVDGFVARWMYDTLADVRHVYDITNDTSVSRVSSDHLKVHRLGANYAASVSQARLVDDYLPYTDQLKNISKKDKEFIMGMGGIRKHSSNDFRIDYVQDYFLFFADLARDGWTGHTYTKSVDYCKIFGRCHDRINLSIAMNTINGKIVENTQEGASHKEARRLREVYSDLGVMAMVTDNAQLSFALNSDWIDMCIPFHASGLPKAVWYNLRVWFDYTNVQLESYYTLAEMKQRLDARGVDYSTEAASRLQTQVESMFNTTFESVQDIKNRLEEENMNYNDLLKKHIESIFNETFGITVIRNEQGNRVRPHFFPNDTYVNGTLIPGHHNNAQRYMELCEQFGVHPRFYGTKVTDKAGNVIDVTEHENYVKLIKETARTDTEQQKIEFNFNQYDDFLGMSPMEYALKRMEEEAKNGGFTNTADDPYGIVDMFSELYLGKDHPIGWLPPKSAYDTDRTVKRLYDTLEITKKANDEIYDADMQTLEKYQKVLVEGDGEVFGDVTGLSEGREQLSIRNIPTDADQFQLRTQTMTTREVLLEAARRVDSSKGIAKFTDAERSALSIYIARSEKLVEAESMRQNLLEQKHELLQGREPKELSKEEKTTLRQIQNNLDTVNEQRKRYDADLLAIEQREVIRSVLKKARRIVAANAREISVERYKAQRDERDGISKYRERVQTSVKTLSEWLRVNSDKQHIPEALKAPVAGLLESIDLSSKRYLSKGELTKADQKFRQTLAEIKRIMDGQQAYLEEQEGAVDNVGAYLDLSEENRQFINDLVSTLSENTTGFVVNEMSAEQLKALSKFLQNLTTAIRNMNKTLANARYQNIPEMGNNTMEYLAKLGNSPDAAANGVATFTQWQNAVPYYAFKRFGAAGEAIFDGFTRGWEKLAYHAQEIIQFTKDLYTPAEAAKWRTTVHPITLQDGTEIILTTAQIMELSQLLGREQARKHIQAGGVRIGNIVQKNGSVHQDVRHHHFSESDLDNIVSRLSERELKVAGAMQRYIATKGGEWGNEISMARFGYLFYTEGISYYPIKTDATGRNMSDRDDMDNSMFRLLNLSASKSLNPHANNALVVGDIFDTFSAHMADMAKLNALGLPLLDAIKWYNFTDKAKSEDGTFTQNGVKKSMEQAFGSKAPNYFRTLIRDINGSFETGDRSARFWSLLTRNYKIAAVAANLRVALLQPTAYIRAMAVLKPKSLLAAFTSKNAYEEAMKYSGTAVWKDLGYYDADIARGIRDKIVQNETLRDKITDKSMALAGKADERTWGRLWVACKIEAKERNGKLTGEELNRATADLFREVIYSTQVMDSTLTRSELMRGKSMQDKLTTSFMSEPTLSYNLLMDAASEYTIALRRHSGTHRAAWDATKGKISRAFITYCVSAAASAIVESIADAFRDDDDYETFLQKFWQAFAGEKSILDGNMAQDLTIIGKIPVIKDLYGAVKGDSGSDMRLSSISNAYTAIQIWRETIQLANGKLASPTDVTYNGKMTTWGKIYKSLQALSQLSGIAVANMTRDAVSIWNTIIGGVNPELKLKTYDPGQETELKNAYLNELVTAEEAIEELVDSGMVDSQDAALRMVYQWDMDGESAYTKLYDAMKTGGDIRGVIAEMEQNGYDRDDIISKGKSKVGEWFMGTEEEEPSITAQEARQMLIGDLGMSPKDADKRINNWQCKKDTGYYTDEIAGALADGEISQAEAERYWVKYAGYTSEDAAKKAGGIVLEIKYPGWGARAYTAQSNYKKYGSGSGITQDQFVNYCFEIEKIKGVDADGDGETDRNSQRNKRWAYIDSLPISTAAKDSLHLSYWAESTLKKAPWH